MTGSRAGALCILLAAALWGTTGTAASLAPGVGPLAIGAAAMGIGGLLQALAAGPELVRGRPRGAQWPVTLLGAVSVAVYPLAFYSSMRLAGVAVGTVVSLGSAPLVAAVVERVVEGRRLTRRWWLAAVLGLAGTALLGTSRVDGTGAGAGGHTAAGVALALVAGLTYALYSWAAHRLMGSGTSSRAAMGAVFGLGGLMLLPVLAVTGGPVLASWRNGLVTGYMALVPMFVGYVLFGRGLRSVPASTATTLSLLEPVVAAVLAVTVVGERLGAPGWCGVALVGACLVVLTVVPARPRTRAETVVTPRGSPDGTAPRRT